MYTRNTTVRNEIGRMHVTCAYVIDVFVSVIFGNIDIEGDSVMYNNVFMMIFAVFLRLNVSAISYIP